MMNLPCDYRDAITRGRHAWMAFGRIRCSVRIASFVLCLVSIGTPHVFGAELFPFTPPTSQQRTPDSPSAEKPRLSREDIARATRLADQAKKLPLDEQKQFRDNIQRKQKDAVRQGNFAQAQYYTELLTQLKRENR